MTDTVIEDKFRKMFDSYYPRVKQFSVALLKSEAESEDVAQEVFLKLWLDTDLWLNNPKIGSLIFTMTRNKIFNIFKHHHIIDEHSISISTDASLISELIEGDDSISSLYYDEIVLLLNMTLKRLPERRRKIFMLSRFEHKSNKDIAESMNISVRTVEHQIYLTLQELKKILLFFLMFI